MIYLLLGVPLVVVLWLYLSIRKLDGNKAIRRRDNAVRRQASSSRTIKAAPPSEVAATGVCGRADDGAPEIGINVHETEGPTLQVSAPTGNGSEKSPPPMFPEPTSDERVLLAEEKKFRKAATALKKEKRYGAPSKAWLNL